LNLPRLVLPYIVISQEVFPPLFINITALSNNKRFIPLQRKLPNKQISRIMMQFIVFFWKPHWFDQAHGAFSLGYRKCWQSAYFQHDAIISLQTENNQFLETLTKKFCVSRSF